MIDPNPTIAGVLIIILLISIIAITAFVCARRKSTWYDGFKHAENLLIDVTDPVEANTIISNLRNDIEATSSFESGVTEFDKGIKAYIFLYRHRNFHVNKER